MPELPEVETIRAGLAAHITGRTISRAEVINPRAARHTIGGSTAIVRILTGAQVTGINRRGKFLWLTLSDPDVLVVHLGMSGQMLIKDSCVTGTDPNFKHLRARCWLDNGLQLWFVDQRTFGYWRTDQLVHDDVTGHRIPSSIRHIAPDLCDVACNMADVAARMKRSRVQVKRLLLDQTVVSGIGNIYADEMLWQARIHPEQLAMRLRQQRIVKLLQKGKEVMARAIAAGGTSFDDLYVNVNGQSGYFERSLNAYGRSGKPCRRCGTLMVKHLVGGRSSHFCPACQKRH